jgi:glutaredoxin 3
VTMVENSFDRVISQSMFTIYTTSAFECPYCVRAKAKLTELGHEFVELDIAQSVIREDLMIRRPDARTVPQIFLANEYIGGCDDLFRLVEQGVLDLLIEANIE